MSYQIKSARNPKKSLHKTVALKLSACKSPVRYLSMLAITLALTACANSPKLSIPIYETPVAYVGLGAGVSMLDVDIESDATFEQRNSTSMAAQVTLGLEMADSWAIEVRHADLGEAEFTNDLKLGYQVSDISALGKLSLGSKASVFGRLGVGALANDGSDFTVTQRNKNHMVLGAGFDVDISKRLALRIEAMGHDIDASHAQLSLIYRFNPRATASAPVSISTSNTAPADTPVARAPAPTSSTSKAIVKPREPSITPMPTITPKPAQVERQTQAKPRVRKPAAPSLATVDSDGDGVVDSKDACAASPAKAIVSSSGCALFGVAVPGVQFAEGVASLNDQSLNALNEVVAGMQKFSDIKVIVGAYSPATGDAAADLLLSRRRTIAVIRYLRGAGVGAARLRPDANALVAEPGNKALLNRIAIRQQ